MSFFCFVLSFEKKESCFEKRVTTSIRVCPTGGVEVFSSVPMELNLIVPLFNSLNVVWTCCAKLKKKKKERNLNLKKKKFVLNRSHAFIWISFSIPDSGVFFRYKIFQFFFIFFLNEILKMSLLVPFPNLSQRIKNAKGSIAQKNKQKPSPSHSELNCL